MSTSKLSTTSYAILGLLAIKPWTTHELVRQVDRSLGRIWPRAHSKLYEEPKKLVALGLARASEESVGRRRRTRYQITPKGRRALRTWLREPGKGPVLEAEQLLKIHFADSGSTDDIRANLDAAMAWAREQNEESLAAAKAYFAGEGPFPERNALNHLAGRFLSEYYAMVYRWAAWAKCVVQDWPDDPTEAAIDSELFTQTLQIAESIPPTSA